METSVDEVPLTPQEVIKKLRELGLVRIISSQLEGFKFVPVGHGALMAETLLSLGFLRHLSAQEVANSRLPDSYDVVQKDGTVIVQKDYNRNPAKSGGKKPRATKDEEVINPDKKKVPVDAKWIAFCYYHPVFLSSPISSTLYIFTKGEDVDYPDFYRIVMGYNVGESWFSSRMHKARKAGHIHSQCKAVRFHPITSIRWCQDQVPVTHKNLLAKLLEEYLASTS